MFTAGSVVPPFFTTTFGGPEGAWRAAGRFRSGFFALFTADAAGFLFRVGGLGVSALEAGFGFSGCCDGVVCAAGVWFGCASEFDFVSAGEFAGGEVCSGAAGLSFSGSFAGCCGLAGAVSCGSALAWMSEAAGIAERPGEGDSINRHTSSIAARVIFSSNVRKNSGPLLYPKFYSVGRPDRISFGPRCVFNFSMPGDFLRRSGSPRSLPEGLCDLRGLGLFLPGRKLKPYTAKAAENGTQVR